MPGILNWLKRSTSAPRSRVMDSETCPICTGMALHYDAIDFNRSCEMRQGQPFLQSGQMIDYFSCLECKFCFAPDMMQWSTQHFTEAVYNEAYHAADPDFMDRRPRANFDGLERMFGESRTKISHLDYGGGAGLMSKLLTDAGWDSTTYDPFFQDGQNPDLAALDRKFDLITVFEVLEHSTDPHRLMKTLASLRSDKGLIFLSTATSNGHILPGGKLDWNYAGPRNGHIALFSIEALVILAEANGLWHSTSGGVFHFFGSEIPSWAHKAIVPV